MTIRTSATILRGAHVTYTHRKGHCSLHKVNFSILQKLCIIIGVDANFVRHRHDHHHQYEQIADAIKGYRETSAIRDLFYNQMYFNINIKSDRTKVKQRRRDFGKGNYKEIRKSLALIDGNDKMKNRTATECLNILRGELDSAIDSYIPMKKQGKRSKKKHLSKEVFRKIRQTKYVEGL